MKLARFFKLEKVVKKIEMISVKATWVWGLINECIFLFRDRWAYDLGGSYKRKVTVFPHRKQELYEVTDN